MSNFNMKEKELFTTIKPEIFIGQLFQSRDIMHLTHLQSTSFSEHKALNSYYDDVPKNSHNGSEAKFLIQGTQW